MDLSTALAEKSGADLVLANLIPTPDRLAVMARDAAGALRLLTGNEVGVLLGHFLLTHTQVPGPLVATTIVSSAQLKAIAEAKGARYEETLTGFKWIGNRALELIPKGLTFVMGYEEALGYTVGNVARDKDGVGAALVVADMAAWCKARGTTLLGYLEEVQREHGLYVAKQYNATLPGASGLANIRSVIDQFRARPPGRIGGIAVTARCDYDAQQRVEAGGCSRLTLPKSNVLAYELEGGGRRHPTAFWHRAQNQVLLRAARDADRGRAHERGEGSRWPSPEGARSLLPGAGAGEGAPMTSAVGHLTRVWTRLAPLLGATLLWAGVSVRGRGGVCAHPPRPAVVGGGGAQRWARRQPGGGWGRLAGAVGRLPARCERTARPRFARGVYLQPGGQLLRVLPGMKFNLTAKLRLFDSGRVAVGAVFEPGPFFNVYGGGATVAGFSIPLGLRLGIHPGQRPQRRVDLSTSRCGLSLAEVARSTCPS